MWILWKKFYISDVWGCTLWNQRKLSFNWNCQIKCLGIYRIICRRYSDIDANESEGSSARHLLNCPRDVNAWRPREQKQTWSLLCLILNPVSTFGLQINIDFKLDQQVYSVVKSSCYDLRLLSKNKVVLSYGDYEQVIHLLNVFLNS